jgi:predicted O-linked N-acetylglucosamine transferase (SPINDLY family)
MPELITSDDAAFIATAIRFGNDPSVLQALRARLAAQRAVSGLFDMRAYARDFAALLHAMHERHARGAAPAHIKLQGNQSSQPRPANP